jgi:hypothetical protein
MIIKKFKKQIFLVLVPHRDTRLEVRKYSETLVKGGLTGFYNFPLAVPAAVLSRPLNTGELKSCARTFREELGENKINTKEPVEAAFPCGEDDMTLFGPCLDLNIPLNIPNGAAQKAIHLFSPMIIGTCLFPPNFHNFSQESDKDCGLQFRVLRETPCKKLTFRAAAAANMIWQPLLVKNSENNDIVYKWKVGKLFWLPTVKKKYPAL